MECGLKWVHMGRCELMLKQGGALLLSFTSGSPLDSQKVHETVKQSKISQISNLFFQGKFIAGCSEIGANV